MFMLALMFCWHCVLEESIVMLQNQTIYRNIFRAFFTKTTLLSSIYDE